MQTCQLKIWYDNGPTGLLLSHYQYLITTHLLLSVEPSASNCIVSTHTNHDTMYFKQYYCLWTYFFKIRVVYRNVEPICPKKQEIKIYIFI